MALELVTPAGQAELPESLRTTWDVRASTFATDSEVFAVDSSSNSEVSRRSMIRYYILLSFNAEYLKNNNVCFALFVLTHDGGGKYRCIDFNIYVLPWPI